jgi:alkylation response protein AidB-like acyl-CoA dehydrogenase
MAELIRTAAAAGEDVAAGLAMAERFGRLLPEPGRGATGVRWLLLADVAAQDLTAARILEAHSDALAILAEAGWSCPDGRWGVFAAEAPNAVLTATQTEAGWTVTGTKPWCSLASVLDHALVTAHVGSARHLFAVDLRSESVEVSPATGWVARGLRTVPSGPVHFTATAARPVGGPGWYLTRPGFAWGGIGVAACWYGGARALADRLTGVATERGGDLMRLAAGRVDIAAHTARVLLEDAARAVDNGHARGQAGEMLALRVRTVVADATEVILTVTGHSLGPGPLAFDETYARRVADLQLYIRQHHAERDLAFLGGMLTKAAG